MRCVLNEQHDRITIGGSRDTNLRFADDTTLMCIIKEIGPICCSCSNESNKPASKKNHCLIHKRQRSSLSRPIFPFIRREVLPATSSPLHLIVLSTYSVSCLLLPAFLLSYLPHISLNIVLPSQPWWIKTEQVDFIPE